MAPPVQTVDHGHGHDGDVALRLAMGLREQPTVEVSTSPVSKGIAGAVRDAQLPPVLVQHRHAMHVDHDASELRAAASPSAIADHPLCGAAPHRGRRNCRARNQPL